MAVQRTDERGLTLIEMMVALFVIGFVLMALASTLTGSLRAVQVSERVVDATQLGNELIEELIALPYERLYLYESEAQAAFDSDEFDEPLHTEEDRVPRDPLVPVPVRNVEVGGTTFEVRTAITEITVDGVVFEPYKRIIIDLRWQVRGEVQSTRVEATRSSTPPERTLTVSVTPDLIRLSDRPEGRNAISFRIDVFAQEPLSAVEANWQHRTGGPATPPGTFLPVAGSDGQHWRLSFTGGTGGRRFANGGTRFEITATAVEGERTVTTVGRATFLHTLGIDNATLVVSPAVFELHPTTGPCSGVSVGVEVIGAVLSDPLTIQFGEGQPKLPTAALDSLVYGTRYGVEFHAPDVPLEGLTVDAGVEYLEFELELLRAADAQDAQLVVRIPVHRLGVDDVCSS